MKKSELRQIIREIIISELDFKSQDAFNSYNKQHKLRKSTKVNIAGKQTTAGQASGEDDFEDNIPNSYKSLVAKPDDKKIGIIGKNYEQMGKPTAAISQLPQPNRRGHESARLYIQGDKKEIQKAIEDVVADVLGGDTVELSKPKVGAGYIMDIPDYYFSGFSDEGFYSERHKKRKELATKINKALQPIVDKNIEDYNMWKKK
jgi:hypothetical protein